MRVFSQLIRPLPPSPQSAILFQVIYIGGAVMSLFLAGEPALPVCSLVKAAAVRLPGVKGR